MIPVILFTYARPNHLTKTLDSLKLNQVPLIYAFSDGPKSPQDIKSVEQVRKILDSVNWCELCTFSHETNMGLGKSILKGVSEVFEIHDKAIIFEDDLICVPGTYEYLCKALDYYENDSRVMSVTGWTHPKIIPRNIGDQPYFDGRAECWLWGSYAKYWKGMEKNAITLMSLCQAKGIDTYKYGKDLVRMAKLEDKLNIWAVRFLYLHILKNGLCLRPPWSMVEHKGFDNKATNAIDGSIWSNPILKTCPPIPYNWPDPIENPECSILHRNAFGGKPSHSLILLEFLKDHIKKIIGRD
jgi:hypothetical protein